MSLTVSLGKKEFTSVKPGTHLARCINIIEVGTTSYIYEGQEVSSNKVRLAFELPNERIEKENTTIPAVLSVEFSLKMGPKANLRKFVENWIGGPLVGNEAESFELIDMLNSPALITVVHNTKGDKTYTDIKSAAPLMKGMECPPAHNALKTLSYGEAFDWEFYGTLPEFLRNKMALTPEFEQQKNQHDHKEGDLPF